MTVSWDANRNVERNVDNEEVVMELGEMGEGARNPDGGKSIYFED